MAISTPGRNHIGQQIATPNEIGGAAGGAIEHLEQALHHLSMANENALAKQVMRRLRALSESQASE